MNEKKHRLYDDLAHLWPLVSDSADYAEEASLWRDALREKLGPGDFHILELGVGGGNNLSHLTAEFKATAVDISTAMLENSRKLNPEVEHLVGDMRDIDLGQKFDAVIIHDAISYMITEADLKATIATAARHLDKGGVFITSPDYVRESFPGSEIRNTKKVTAEFEFVHIEYEYDPDPDDTVCESLMFYIINKNGKLQIEQDLHVLGVFPIATWQRLFENGGFTFEIKDYPVHEDKRQGYMFVGVKK